MNIHEYQAKQLFKEYNVKTLEGVVATNASEAANACKTLGGNIWVVKAQVHAGGRGKGGGIILCKTTDEVYEAADKLIGSNLVTPQTTSEGVMVRRVYVEEGCDISTELYLGIVLDRERDLPVVMASVEGGVEIEEIAIKEPEKILKVYADPVTGIGDWQARKIAFGLGLKGKQVNSCCNFIKSLYKLFLKLDCSIVEINPLVVTSNDDIIALDAKINFDSSALFRHGDIEKLRDLDEEEPLESQATKAGLNYIKLDGEIGCMVNGAGLAMSTMDIIKLHGGEPANFLDVGGGATAEQVAEGFRIILSDPEVKAIFVNIFGGIMRCDFIAEGIITAAKEIELNVPLIVRLAGTNVDLGKKMLSESGLDLITADDMDGGARKSVKAVRGGQ
ncbi:MAG: succinate--CoA ligase subunit beta [Marine Group III euryarchaeote CG-Epi3]|jgi:succinyl-CoA synthetase beta subunit|uniref:Succinate--CoA ligase [ADP-forming] subunit beta n=1 Tax=Marine Group III euryarchaeote CG-Epi3 TaxID=1888997 RepID=A0A1J5U388_9ARCH|nr:ADP-forming succinate--CoA ligase subunit beta [Candidatus Poseidoniia archaeon]OIR22880.1 MAG: succinate--CoA ligase subunit beta [Marine Group III euryarchaeote CG-Epi3]|tara:strand:+ start:2037 stop:3206 length:1170 start_codon:yes stop_codon:yes gene_type:complete